MREDAGTDAARPAMVNSDNELWRSARVASDDMDNASSAEGVVACDILSAMDSTSDSGISFWWVILGTMDSDSWE